MIKLFNIFFLFLFIFSCNKVKEEEKKMNLLFIWTDQQRFDTMEAYGNDKIKTPNFNSLADKSIVFKKAYVTQPVCTPSRSSVMTGLYPHTNGCIENNIPLKSEIKTVPELINDPQYKTAYMGKWHLGDEVFAQQGFKEWYATEDNYTRFYSDGRDVNYRSEYHHWLLGKGVKPDNKDNTFSRDLSANLPLRFGKPKFLEESAVKFMEENKDNPFILYINFLEPHAPFSSVLNDYHTEEDLIIPEDKTVFDSLTHRNKIRRLTKYGVESDEVPDMVRRYWGLISKVDMSLGVIMQKLSELGLDENTLVIFTSDHGEMLGSHAFKTKRFAYDESSRVPLLMRLPGSATQRIIEEPVSHIDIVPTILDYMGYSTKESLQGKSLVPVLNGGNVKDNYVFFEMSPMINFIKRPKKMKEDVLTKIQLSRIAAEEVFYAHYRVVVSPDGWKMVVSDKDKNQLFNLNTDSLEYDNLYYTNNHSEVISRLSEKLNKWQQETADQLILNY